MLEFLAPVEYFGQKFDRGSILFEFSALREPEATQFPLVGAWLRARGIEFREVPTPSMLWRGAIWPDLYIANQLAALPEGWGTDRTDLDETSPPKWTPSRKSEWSGAVDLQEASIANHGKEFHDAFIEPICRKIAGRSSSEIAAKYHRALWLPLYWPQTLRSRKSIPTPFYYPATGYAGGIRSAISGSEQPHSESGKNVPDAEGVQINVAYIVAKPARYFSVLFVVDDSPIYRVTNQDMCAGKVPDLHRLIVEYRGECDVPAELERLGLSTVEQIAYGSTRLQIPTLANVAAGWKPRPHINNRLWRIINEK